MDSRSIYDTQGYEFVDDEREIMMFVPKQQTASHERRGQTKQKNMAQLNSGSNTSFAVTAQGSPVKRTGPQPPMREDSGQWVDVSIDNRTPSRNTSSRSTGVTPIKERMSLMKLSSPQGPPQNVIVISSDSEDEPVIPLRKRDTSSRDASPLPSSPSKIRKGNSQTATPTSSHKANPMDSNVTLTRPKRTPVSGRSPGTPVASGSSVSAPRSFPKYTNPPVSSVSRNASSISSPSSYNRPAGKFPDEDSSESDSATESDDFFSSARRAAPSSFAAPRPARTHPEKLQTDFSMDVDRPGDANISPENGKRPVVTALSAFPSDNTDMETDADINISSSDHRSFIHHLFDRGVTLPTNIVAHDSAVQRLFDNQEISWGVQWELARGVSTDCWTWDEVRDKLLSSDSLRGTEEEVLFNVALIMKNQRFSGASLEYKIGKQMWLEQQALMENRGRGLGPMGDFQGETRWYGGRIQQIGHLIQINKKDFKVELQPLEMRKSTRFTRYLGSRRVLQLRVSDNLLMKGETEVREFLARKFVICGRVFVPWVPKEGSLYLVEGNENYERTGHQKWCGDQYRLSYPAILEWHNPALLNSKQPIAKYVTRNTLGLSTSVPGLIFEERNILEIADETTPDWNGEGKPSAEQLMTDGCGFINESALRSLTTLLGLSVMPTAVQGRIAGSKGLWIRHPRDFDDEHKIWIRPSQKKINYAQLDYSHRILDIVSTGYPSTSSTLSAQSILNLSFNGVPQAVLVELLKEGLVRTVDPLIEKKGRFSDASLWTAVNQAGGVSSARVQRLAGSLARVLGYTRREWHDTVVYDDKRDDDKKVPDDYTEEQSLPVCTGRKEYSGAPLSVYEVALDLIQAGFTPSKSHFLREKMRYVIDQSIKSAIEGFHVSLPEGKSAEAYVIPDPTGLLRPREIFYYSSKAILDKELNKESNIVEGDVRAVNIPELHEYKNVIVVSVQGDRSLMTLLSGGDFDGDVCFLLWLASLVQGFQDKLLRPPPKDFMETHFERDIQSVAQFQDCVEKNQRTQSGFVDILMTGLTKGRVGLYSMFHDKSVRKYGYDSDQSIMLAYMFNTLLDAGKTGHRLRLESYQDHDKDFNKLAKSSDKRDFILDVLEDVGKSLRDDILKEYEQQTLYSGRDADLIKPLQDIKRRIAAGDANGPDHQTACRVLAKELELVEEHVLRVNSAYKSIPWHSISASTGKSKKVKGVQKEDPTRKVAAMYASEVPGIILMSDREVTRLKASFAYKEMSRHNENFAFAVAFKDLCDIKASESSDGAAAVTRALDEMKSIPASARKLVETGLEMERRVS
ncbi:RNA dependent RNA polymerase-domain-containing protein [Armillaria nabsnona]|nr:RNA dependent RNA polymerase-domain-containing protein [Armillaria nabsnona]